MKPVCYLDLDGCLVDFVAGALKIHGMTIPPQDVRWGFPEQIGFSGVDDPDFWIPLEFSFWRGLEWTKEGPQLLEAVESVFGDRVILLTSPCDTPGCVEGKVAWIKKNAPRYRRRYLVGPPKPLLAGASKILVDDYEGNIDRFAAEGGNTVMIPRPWNKRRDETTDGVFNVTVIADELRRIAEKAVPMDVNDLIQVSHSTALSKGWWESSPENPERTFGDQIALMHSELSEALEEFRKTKLDNLLYFIDEGKGGRKPEGIAAEFADVWIRMADTAGRYGIPLKEAIRVKTEYNLTRAFRHGGKAI